MATKNTEVDIDLDDFDLDELLEEVSDRYDYECNKKTISDFFKEMTGEDSEIPIETVEDELKLNLFKWAIKKYSLTELEEKLK